jgi:pimeloyl-ACP methyl ester carboxylesterase
MPGMGGRLDPEQLDGMVRNQWTDSTGIGGRIGPEYASWRREEAYSLEAMAEDALAVLDACDVEKAHLVGLSLGGFVAQEVAIKTPQRVASLTLMSTAGDPTDESLPEPKVWAMLRSALPTLPILRYRLLGGESNLVKERAAKLIAYVGADAVDIEELAELVVYDLRHRRGLNLKAFRQHQAAVAITRSRYPLLQELAIPALVIHGTEDLIFPFEHAQKLVELLPKARLLALDGVGHYFPMQAVTEEIVSHLRGGG